MAEGNLTLRVVADVTDLQAKLAIAKSNVVAFSSETRALANQYREAGDAGAMQFIPALEKSAHSAAAAKAQVAALNSQLQKTAASAGGFREIFNFGAGGSFTARLREATSLISGLGEVLAAGFAAKMMVGAIEGTAKLGAELNKLSKITGVSVETLSGWHYGADQMSVSAEALDTAMVRLGRNVQMALSTPSSQAAKAFELLGLSQDYLKANSNDLQAVLMKMADAFHTHADGANADALAQATMSRSGAQLLPFLRLGSQAIADLTQKNKDLGGEIDGPMAEAMERHVQLVKDMGTSWEGFWITLTNKIIPTLNALFSTITANLTGDAMRQYTAMVMDEAAGATGGERIGTTARPSPEGSTATGAPGSAPGPGAAAAGKASGDSQLPQFGNMDASTGGVTAVEKFRAQVAEMEATWRGAHTAMLAESVRMWQADLATAGLSQKEKYEVQSSLTAATHALNQAVATESATIARQDADTDLQISKMKLSATKNTLDEELAARKITAAQWLTAMQAEVAQEYALDKQRLDNELASLTPLTAEYDRVYNQIRMLKAKNVADLAALDKQAAANSTREAQAAARDWENSFKPINSAFNTMISGIVSGRNTLGQTLRSAAQQWVTQEIEADAQVLLHKLENYAAELAGVEISEASKQAAQATTNTMSLAGLAAKALKAIFTYAAEAFGGVFANQAPAEGPYAAIPAAAASAAVLGVTGMVSAEGGMWTVPGNTLAVLHPQESVWPAGPAAAARDFFANGGQRGAQAGGVSVEPHFHIHAIDTQTGASFLVKNMPLIAKQIAKTLQANPSWRGNY